jgi:hypothetical protein
MSIVKLTSAWFGLVVFTLVAIMASLSSLEHNYLLMLVAVITMFKGMLVADVFMELRSAPKVWYRLMASYVILVPCIIFLIYFLS